MKKYRMIILCLLAGFGIMGLNQRTAKAAEGDVAINATNFPDTFVREEIKKKDKNKDGVLSKAEIEAVKKLELDNEDEKTKKCKPMNLKGCEVFCNVGQLILCAKSVENLDALQNLSQLTDLQIGIDAKVTKLDVSKMKFVKKLRIYVLETEELVLPNADTLESLRVIVENSTANLKHVELKSYTKLKKIFLQVDNTDKFIFNAPNATELELWIQGKTSAKVENMPALKSLLIDESYDFKKLIVKNCPSLMNIEVAKENKIEKVELSNLPKLWALRIAENHKLKSLDLSEFSDLEDLSVDTDKLTKLVFPKKCNLLSLSLSGKLKKLDVSKYKNLSYLGLSMPNIKKLNVNSCKKLEAFDLREADKMTSLDISKLTKLENLTLGYMKKLKKVKFPKAKKVKTLEVYSCPLLKDLGFGKMKNIKQLTVNKNKAITKLDIRKLKKLETLEWKNGKLKKVIWGKSKELTTVDVSGNQLSGKLYLSKIPYIVNFECNRNKLTYIKGSSTLCDLGCDSNKLKTVDLRKSKNLTGMSCEKNKKVKIYLAYHLEYGPHVDKSAKVHYEDFK